MRTLYDDTPEQQDPFEPNGARPRWEILWDMTENLQPKDSVTYVDALEAIRAEGDLEIDIQGAQKAMIKVNDKRAEHGLPLLKTVPKFGWVVTTPSSELDRIDDQRRKTRRAAERGMKWVVGKYQRAHELSTVERSRLGFIGRQFEGTISLFESKSKTTKELLKYINNDKTEQFPLVAKQSEITSSDNPKTQH